MCGTYVRTYIHMYTMYICIYTYIHTYIYPMASHTSWSSLVWLGQSHAQRSMVQQTTLVKQ